jgi:hypothetical protein
MATVKYVEEKILVQKVDSQPMNAFVYDLFALITPKIKGVVKGLVHVTYVKHEKM